MSHEMIQHDTALISSQLRITLGAGGDDKARFTIQFQFPPKIKEDSRGGEWKEEAAGPTAGDPIAYYENGKARSITMEWSYIVGAGAGWTGRKIWTQLNALRRYFVNGVEDSKDLTNSVYGNLAVHVLIWDHGGANPHSFRLRSAGIKHGDAMVKVGDRAFHLRTDVSVNLLSWPKILNVQFAPGQIITAADWF